MTGLGIEELREAIGELTENAVTHSDRERPHIAITLSESSDWVTVTVTDDGPGIPSMEYDALENEQVSAISHGKGFGLNLAYWIVRRSGGQLFVEDRDPRGSKVTLRFPKENGHRW